MTPLFWTNVPGKTQCGQTGAAIQRVLLLCSFHNTTRVPKMVHLTENALGSSTSPPRQRFWLINHWMNNPTVTIATSTALRHSDRDCVTLSSSPTMYSLPLCYVFTAPQLQLRPLTRFPQQTLPQKIVFLISLGVFSN